ncbi:MAG: hypothetical protein H7096_04960 [Flavobacterium sp.]|nr:hypothetical protein [Pedobacter sp.]
MSNWLNKSNTSSNVAQNLCASKHYDVAIHCSYYSCVQLMLHYLEFYFGLEQNEIDNMLNPKQNGGDGLHKALGNYYYNSIDQKDEDDAFKFSNVLGKIRRHRITADYQKTISNPDNFNNCDKWQSEITDILNKHYD